MNEQQSSSIPPIIPPKTSKPAGMKKNLFCLPLICLPALGHFLVPYFEGRGFIPQSFYMLDGVSFLVLPFAIAGSLAFLASTSVFKRAVIFIVTLVIQFALLFTLVPGSAESEMVGFTQRMKQEFSADELRTCAADLRQKEQSGTLTLKDLPDEEGLTPWTKNDAHLVDDSQLPANLQGKFQHVLIWKYQSSGSQQTDIVFELEWDRGILCSTNHYENDFWRHQMADGVYAYRYMRP